MLDILEIICVKKHGNYVTAIHGKIRDQPGEEPKTGTIFAKDGHPSILLKYDPEPLPVRIMKVSETTSGSEIGEANIACFIAMDPNKPSHNVLEDFPASDELIDG